MIPHDELLDNVAAYALGVLPPAEAAEVAKHLQTCDRCREEYRFLRPAVTAVAYSGEGCTDAATGSVVASPLLKARVMNRVRAEAARQSRPRRWPAYALAAACLAIAIVMGLANVALNGRLQREAAQVNAQAQIIADLSAADARRYAFTGGAVVARGNRLYLTMRDLPAPPSGHTYQAWTLANGAARVAPSLTFEPTSGVTIVRLPESALTTTAVAVSVEPAGGSQQPTTKPMAFVRI
jgi:anti-sigma-K factor RskA